MKQPNLLFIMADQLRWDAIGEKGAWVKTPNIDRIAREGIVFNQCLTNSPVCIPARVALATGQYPHNTGVIRNSPAYDMPPEKPTWMQAVRNAGYRTSLFGKTHLHRHQGDLREREHLMHAYGFDDVDEIGGPRACMWVKSHMTELWERLGLLDDYIADYNERFATKAYMARPSVLPLEHYADVYVGTKAKAYLERVNNEQPWFCMVSFGGPHEPWDAPEPYASMYDHASMPKAIPRPPQDIRRPQGHLDTYLSKGDQHSPDLSEWDVAAMRANYAGMITLIDDQIGEILQTLEKRDMLDETVIIFTSDHGEMNGDYGLIYKETFLNSATRVPLIVRTPETIHRNIAGTVSDEMVEMFDIGPTFVELAGGEWNTPHFAKSLLPVIRDAAAIHREEALVEVHGEYLLQSREWKLALNRKGEPYLLFHLAEDPDEQHNLISDAAYKEVVDRLCNRLLQRLVTSQQC